MISSSLIVYEVYLHNPGLSRGRGRYLLVSVRASTVSEGFDGPGAINPSHNLVGLRLRRIDLKR